MSEVCFKFLSTMNDCVKYSKVIKRSKLPDSKTKLPFQRCYKQTFQNFSSKHFNIYMYKYWKVSTLKSTKNVNLLN